MAYKARNITLIEDDIRNHNGIEVMEMVEAYIERIINTNNAIINNNFSKIDKTLAGVTRIGNVIGHPIRPADRSTDPLLRPDGQPLVKYDWYIRNDGAIRMYMGTAWETIGNLGVGNLGAVKITNPVDPTTPRDLDDLPIDFTGFTENQKKESTLASEKYVDDKLSKYGTLDEVYKVEEGNTITDSDTKVLNIEEVATLVKAQRTIDDGALTDFTDKIIVTALGGTGKLEYRDALKVADGAPEEDVITAIVNANISGANIGYSTLIHPYDRIAQPGAWFEGTTKQDMEIKYTFPGSSKGIGFSLDVGQKYKWETIAKYENNALVMYVKFSSGGNILVSDNALTTNPVWNVAAGSSIEYKLDEIMPNGSRFALAQMEAETHAWAVGDEVLSLEYHTTLSFVKNRLLRLIKDMQEPVKETMAKSGNKLYHVDAVTSDTTAALWVKGDTNGFTDDEYAGLLIQSGQKPKLAWKHTGQSAHQVELDKFLPQNNLLTGRIGDSQVYELNTMVPYDHRFKVKTSLGIYDIGHNTDAPQNNRFLELELTAASHNIELPLVDNWYFLKTPYELGGSSYYGIGADSGDVKGGTIRFKVKVYANQSHIVDSFNRIEITEIDLYDPYAGKTVDITGGGNPLSLKWTKGMAANSEQHKLLAKRDWLKELRMVNI